MKRIFAHTLALFLLCFIAHAQPIMPYTAWTWGWMTNQNQASGLEYLGLTDVLTETEADDLYQGGSANLTNWAALATSAKQNAFTTGNGVTNDANILSANLAAGANVTFTTNAFGVISIAGSAGSSGNTNAVPPILLTHMVAITPTTNLMVMVAGKGTIGDDQQVVGMYHAVYDPLGAFVTNTVAFPAAGASTNNTASWDLRSATDMYGYVFKIQSPAMLVTQNVALVNAVLQTSPDDSTWTDIGSAYGGVVTLTGTTTTAPGADIQYENVFRLYKTSGFVPAYYRVSLRSLAANTNDLTANDLTAICKFVPPGIRSTANPNYFWVKAVNEINVCDWGVSFSPSADSASGLENCFEYAESVFNRLNVFSVSDLPRTIRIPAGFRSTSRTLYLFGTVGASVSVVGDGKNISTLTYTGTGALFRSRPNMGGMYRGEMSDFAMYGPGMSSGTSGLDAIADGLLQRFTFRNLHIQGFSLGLAASGVLTMFENIQFMNCHIGLFAEGNNGGRYDHLYFAGCATPFIIEDGGPHTMTGIHYESCFGPAEMYGVINVSLDGMYLEGSVGPSILLGKSARGPHWCGAQNVQFRNIQGSVGYNGLDKSLTVLVTPDLTADTISHGVEYWFPTNGMPVYNANATAFGISAATTYWVTNRTLLSFQLAPTAEMSSVVDITNNAQAWMTYTPMVSMTTNNAGIVIFNSQGVTISQPELEWHKGATNAARFVKIMQPAHWTNSAPNDEAISVQSYDIKLQDDAGALNFNYYPYYGVVAQGAVGGRLDADGVVGNEYNYFPNPDFSYGLKGWLWITNVTPGVGIEAGRYYNLTSSRNPISDDLYSLTNGQTALRLVSGPLTASNRRLGIGLPSSIVQELRGKRARLMWCGLVKYADYIAMGNYAYGCFNIALTVTSPAGTSSAGANANSVVHLTSDAWNWAGSELLTVPNDATALQITFNMDGAGVVKTNAVEVYLKRLYLVTDKASSSDVWNGLLQTHPTAQLTGNGTTLITQISTVSSPLAFAGTGDRSAYAIGDSFVDTNGAIAVVNAAGTTLNPGVWATGTAYGVGDLRTSIDGTKLLHCVKAGTSAGAEPTWDTTMTNNVADNTAIWGTIQSRAATLSSKPATAVLGSAQVIGALAADNLTVTNAVTAGSFVGDGSGLTNISAQFGVTIGDGATAITTGAKAWARVPYDMTITGWEITGDAIGSIVVDVWNDSYANFPPTVADTIAGSEKPTLSGVIKATDVALGTWTTTVAEGSYVRFNVDSVDGALVQVNVSVFGTRN